MSNKWNDHEGMIFRFQIPTQVEKCFLDTLSRGWSIVTTGDTTGLLVKIHLRGRGSL